MNGSHVSYTIATSHLMISMLQKKGIKYENMSHTSHIVRVLARPIQSVPIEDNQLRARAAAEASKGRYYLLPEA